MATTITIPNSFTPFTKIRSADMNANFVAITTRINWAGGTDATTGLGDDNIQSNAASGGGLTRSTKLKAGTINHVLINDSSGLMSSEAQLALTRGGTGISVTPGSFLPGDVLQINSTSTALEVGTPSSVPGSLKIYTYYRFG